MPMNDPGQPTEHTMPASKLPPQGANPAPAIPYAPLYRRLFAMVYDIMLLAAVLFCVAGAYFTALILLQAGGGPAVESIGQAQTGDVLRELDVIEPGWPFYPLMAAVYLGFFVYFWRISGQTLGMRAWKIKLEDCNGGKPATWKLFARLPAAALSLACAGLGYWVLLLPGINRSWHDSISGTRVVQLQAAS